jgi:hypothetical protein
VRFAAPAVVVASDKRIDATGSVRVRRPSDQDRFSIYRKSAGEGLRSLGITGGNKQERRESGAQGGEEKRAHR